eukprot:scaffold5016_cov118-Isochrysis_galbana.AAC.19
MQPPARATAPSTLHCGDAALQVHVRCWRVVSPSNDLLLAYSARAEHEDICRPATGSGFSTGRAPGRACSTSWPG